MATVHLLHGLPGSGKTTFARTLEQQERAILLCHDEWMVKLYGRNPPLEYFASYAENVSQLMWQLVTRLLSADNNIVLDWGFWTRKEREVAKERIANAGGTVVLYQMCCPPALARERTLFRSLQGHAPEALNIDGPAWDIFAAKFEPLAADEPRIQIPSGLDEGRVSF